MKLPEPLRRVARLVRPATSTPPSKVDDPAMTKRPLDPTPEFRPFPTAKYLYAVNSIPRNYAGRSASIIAKARVFSEQAGVLSTLVAFQHSSELTDVEHELRERGAIGEHLNFVCLHDYYPDDTTHEGADITYPLDEPGLHWIKDPDYRIFRFFDADGVYRFYKRYDHAGRMIVRDHFNHNRARTLREEFRPNGTIRRRVYMDLHHNQPRQEIQFRRDQTPAFNVWWSIDASLRRNVEQVTAFDEDGRPDRVYDSLDPINHLCLDRLIDGERAFIMCEDRWLDPYLLSYRQSRAKTIYVLHNAHISEPYNDPKAVRLIYRPLLEAREQVDAIVFLTATQRAEAEAVYGRTPSFKVLPHSVGDPKPEPEVAREPGLVLMMARLDTQKQVDHGINAFAMVVKQVPEARLEIYGRGPFHASLSALIRTLGLADHAKLMGFTDHPNRAYQRASLCMVTSRFEGAPLTIQESMSYGCPVVSYDLRYGPADIIEDGTSGLLVPYGDRSALANAIVTALREPEQLARLSTAASVRAAQFGERPFAARWGALFRQLDAAGWEDPKSEVGTW